MCRAGTALRADAGTLCSAGRAMFLGCAGGLLSAVGTLKLGRCAVLGAQRCATSARNDERARTRNLGSTNFVLIHHRKEKTLKINRKLLKALLKGLLTLLISY